MEGQTAIAHTNPGGAAEAAGRRSWAGIVPAAGRPFVKMQGLGNHFAIIDARARPFAPAPAEAARICDVTRGVGADELVIIQPPTPAGAAAGASAFMRIINIDGKDAEACGNALRCVGWLLLEETGRDSVVLETMVGPLRCARLGERRVRVEMGRLTADWRAIPLAHPVDTLHVPVGNGPLRDGVALAIGNPHLVYFVDRLDGLDIAALARPIQIDPLFPQQVNVGVAQLVDDGHIRLSVYERPGILTTACGSGACAAVQAARLRGLTGRNEMSVDLPAGRLDVRLDEHGHASQAGPVEFCFSGRLTGLETGQG